MESIFHVLVICRTLYALSAWSSFHTTDLIAKTDAFLHRELHPRYSCEPKCLSDLLYHADKKLFRRMTATGHQIHQLLPTYEVLPTKLRSSHCVFALPHCHYILYKHSFLLRNFLDEKNYEKTTQRN